VLSFLLLIGVLNPIQMLSVLVYPFSSRLFRSINRACARCIWSLWVWLAEIQMGIRVRFTGDSIPCAENAIVLANHQSTTDILVMLCFAWRSGRLGDLKFFVKDVLKYLPGVGWGMKFLDCIFVKRSWVKDKAAVDQLFGKFKAHGIPIFLVSFLEGTRFTEEKLAASQEFARKRDIYVPQHTLVPRTKGFVATVHGLREHVDAVYSVTIAYPRPIPSLWDCAVGPALEFNVYMRRYPVMELPQDDEALNDWVLDRYRDMDNSLATYAEKGVFPGEPMGCVTPGPKALFSPREANTNHR
jgi:1-acyl-sn-glycerol-3-phosphate acyltransferase